MLFHFFQGLLIMVVLPLISIMISVRRKVYSIDVLMKWILFWTIGFRSVTAGLVQLFYPKYTASIIFGLSGDSFYIFIRELGMANISIGLAAMLCIRKNQWITPVTFITGMFYVLLTVNHIINFQAGIEELISLIFDILVLVISGLYLFRKVFYNRLISVNTKETIA